MNTLFPIFVKLDQIQILLVGAGAVGLEKLQAMLGNSPEAKIHVVAEQVGDGARRLAMANPNVRLSERPFRDEDLEGVDLAVLATDNAGLNGRVRQLASSRHILLNVADKPALCDFYLGSVVRKGNLKIGISTNGKSPTIAKRLKEILQDILPNELDETLELMAELRESLKGDLRKKIKVLNEHTKLLTSPNSAVVPHPKEAQRPANWRDAMAAPLGN